MSTKLSNGVAGALVATEDDMHFKMSKKIAQLTKVIYTLNCRNEDSEERVQWLTRNHNEEVRRLIDECERRVAEANAKAQAVERAKQEFATELERKHRTTLQEAKDAFADKVSHMVKELEDKKRFFDESVRDVREESAARLREELDALRKTKDDSAATLVKEYNEKYNEMLVEQMDARDRLEKELELKWARKLSAVSDELVSVQAQLQGQLGDKNQALQDAAGKNLLLSKQLAAAKESADSLEVRVGQLTREKKDLEDKLAAQQSSRGAAEAALEAAEQRAADRAAALAAAESAVAQREQEMAQLRRVCERGTSDLTAAENARDAAEASRQRAEHEAAEAARARDALATRVEELTAQLESLGSTAAGKESALSDLEEKLLAAKTASEEERSRHAAELNKLRDENASALREAVQKSSATSEAMAAALEKEKQSTAEEHRRVLATLQEEHAQRVASLEAEMQRQRELLESQLQRVSAQESELAGQLAEARREGEALRTELQQVKDEWERLSRATESRQAADTATINRLTLELSALAESGATSVDEERRARQDMEQRAQRERDELTAAHEARERAARERAERDRQDAAAAHAREMELAEQAHAAAMRGVRESTDKRLAQAAEEAQDAMGQARAAAERQLRELRESSEATERQLRGRLETLERQLELTNTASASEKMAGSKALLEKDERIASLLAEMQQLRDAHACTLAANAQAAEEVLRNRLAERETAHEAALAEVRRQSEEAAEAHAALAVKMEKDLEDQLMQAEEKHRQSLQNLKAQIFKDHQDVMDSITTMHSTRVRELEAAAEEAIASLQHKLDSAIGEAAAQQARVESLQTDLARVTASSEAAQRQWEEERQRARASSMAAETAQREALARVESEKAAQLNRIAVEHKRIVDDFAAQQAEERAAHQAMTDQLKSAYDALLYKYQFRESRPEDVTLINKLLQDNHDKEKALQKAYDEMKLYKLELINREENYNKLFGRRPLVANDAMSPSPPEAGTAAAASRSLPAISNTRQPSVSQSLPLGRSRRFSK